MLRALRDKGKTQPVDAARQRRQLAAARKAAFADVPSGRNQVWQIDFSDFETTTGGTWRICGVADYYLHGGAGLACGPHGHLP